MMNIFKKKTITLDRILLFATFFFFLAYTLYSYIGQPWYLKAMTTNALSQNSNSGTINKMLLFAALVCMLVLIFTQCLKRKLSPVLTMSLSILFLFAAYWTGYSILIDKVTVLVLVRDPFPPVTFLLPLAILIGMKDSLWKDVKKYIFVGALILIGSSLISAIRFYSTFGTSYRPVASGMIYWFYKGFFLMYATILFTDEWKVKYKPVVLITILVMFFIAAILQARSWFIQTIVLFIVYLAVAKNRRGSNILTIIVSLFVMLIFFALNEDAFAGLIDRFTSSGDTRTSQLTQFFEQVGFKNLFLGQGMKANYNFGHMEEFGYIDNQFLLSMFRYGAVPTFLYMFLLIYPIFRSMDERNSKCFKESFLIIVWMAAIFGLSVYFNLSFEIAGFVIFVMVGRMISQLESYRSALWRKV